VCWSACANGVARFELSGGRGQFFEDFTSYEVVAGGFFGVEMMDGS
jgi:hypothetical protein